MGINIGSLAFHHQWNSTAPTTNITMKLAVIACLACVSLAAPQQLLPNPVAILRDERTDNGDGTFSYVFEADNGIAAQASGVQGFQGGSNVEGSYRFPLDDGSGFVEVRYAADENGFRAESPFLPTPHPTPAHVIELLRIAEEQRAAGITFE
ncbi:cuticle protein AM1159-like [Macrobrachium nipponense]|uniref:cuticle protein AM1159-like n=1 Tax=Macrobrachium nipponense TaxID=159736 RepID=UPI0030C869CB